MNAKLMNTNLDYSFQEEVIASFTIYFCFYYFFNYLNVALYSLIFRNVFLKLNPFLRRLVWPIWMLNWSKSSDFFSFLFFLNIK